MPDPNSGAGILCVPAQLKRTWTCHKSHVVWKFTGKMPDPNSGASILCVPAQSKRTWTFHKSHFVWRFTGKMPNAYENTSIKHRALTFSVATLFGEFRQCPKKMKDNACKKVLKITYYWYSKKLPSSSIPECSPGLLKPDYHQTLDTCGIVPNLSTQRT